MTQVVGSDSSTMPPSDPAASRRALRQDRAERARTAARSIGEGFITMGVVLLLFCTYQLFWTNVSSDNQTTAEISQIKQAFIIPVGPPVSGQPTTTTIADGQGYGLIYIPRLGSDWVKPLVQGASLTNLKKGIVHYATNAQPGEIGNFAVAGHRATNGEPFRNLDQMKIGDSVYLQTSDSWITYKVSRIIIVKPTDTWVLDPVPDKPGVVPTTATLTMTTCNPRWASYQRLIVFGYLADKTPKALGPPPAIASLV